MFWCVAILTEQTSFCFGMTTRGEGTKLQILLFMCEHQNRAELLNLPLRMKSI